MSSAAARQAGATTLTQNSENFGYSRVRLRRIVKMQFGIVNPLELVRFPIEHDCVVARADVKIETACHSVFSSFIGLHSHMIVFTLPPIVCAALFLCNRKNTVSRKPSRSTVVKYLLV